MIQFIPTSEASSSQATPQQQNTNLQQVFDLLDLDQNIYQQIIRMMKKEKCSDCIEYLSKQSTIERIVEEQIIGLPRSSYQSSRIILQSIQQLIKAIQNLICLDFFNQNYTEQDFQEKKKEIIQQIQNNEKSQSFLIFLVQLTAIDSKFIQCGSNSLNLLVESHVDLKDQNLRYKNQKYYIVWCQLFARTNLSGSQFENVEIGNMNLCGAMLFNCKWSKLSIFGEQIRQLDGHNNAVVFVCFSPEGATLASGSSDSSIRLWDVKTGQQKAQLNVHSSYVTSVCFSPDSATFVSGSYDNSIRFWDVIKRRQLRRLDGHSNTVFSVCFSPDGATLASGSGDQSIRLWDVKTGQQRAQLDGHSSTVLSVCFSPDGATVASGSWDQSIRLWDVKTGQQRAQLDGHSNAVISVCFSPDGGTLASGSYDQSIRLWDVKTGQQRAQLDDHNGTTLASGSQDKSICLRDFKTGLETSSTNQKCEQFSQSFHHQEFNNFSQNFNFKIILNRISQSPQLLVYNAQVFKTDFINFNGVDLTYLLQSKGAIFIQEMRNKNESTQQKHMNNE